MKQMQHATATATIDDATGEVTSITITNLGSGYISAPTVVIDGDGTNATADSFSVWSKSAYLSCSVSSEK